MLEIFYQSVNVSTINIPYEKSIIPSLEFMSKFVEETHLRVEGASRRLTGWLHDLEELKDWPSYNQIKLYFRSLLQDICILI